jgi:hypothetical protein
MKINEVIRITRLATTQQIQTGSWVATAALVVLLSTFAVSNAQAQQIFNETFDNDNNKAAGTTADWDTTASTLRLPDTGTIPPIESLVGSFLPAALGRSVDVSESDETRDIAVGDLNGDGFVDLVFGNQNRNSVYFNDGFGAFARGANIPNDFVSGNTRSVAVADFNGDGHLDMIHAEYGGGQATRIHFNNGSGSNQIFTDGDFVDLGDPSLRGDSVAVGDVDNDADIDVVIGVEGGYVKLFRNDGFGNFAAAEDIVDSVTSAGFHARTVLLGDLDRDGDLDVVAVRETDDARIYLNNGSGVFALPQATSGTFPNSLPAPDSAALGDVNGDGLLDLIVGNDGEGSVTGTARPNYLFLNSGGATIFPDAPFTFSDGANTNGVAVLDVDRDGDLDIVTADFVLGNGNNTPGPNRLYVNDPVANSPNIFPALGSEITADIAVTKAVASGDFDRDGDLDLVFGNAGNGGVSSANRIVDNVGTASGVSFPQLFATGLSIQYPPANLSTGVLLESGSTNSEANPVFEYWLSDDGGVTWIVAHPDRSVAFPETAGNNVTWRVEMNSPSPLLTPGVDFLRLRTNIAPSFTSTPVDTATQDVPYSYSIEASDPQGEVLDIRVGAGTTLPAWLTLTDNNSCPVSAGSSQCTATLSGTPLNADVAGPNDVTLEVVDGAGLLDTQTFSIVVADANDPPAATFPTPDQIFAQNDELLVGVLDTSLAFEDPDGDVLTYSATGLPASLTIATDTGMVTGTLTNDDVFAGPFSVVVTADDGNGGTGTDDFTITVTNVNDAPTFTSDPVITATEATEYVYTVVAEDIDGDNVTITGGGLSWLTLTDNGDGTAVLSGTPVGADVGVPVNVTLNVSDGSLTGEQTFTIAVAALADVPVITLNGNATVTLTVGDTYTEEGATALDAQDGDLTDQIIIDSSAVDTGTVGTYTVTYSVSDSAGNVGTAQRTVIVTELPDTTPPVITLNGGNVTLTVGDSYAEQGATATDDRDGDITADIVIGGDTVDTGTAGTYTVTYNVSDAAGNAATEVTRTVTVTAAPPPPPPPPPPSGGGGGGSSSLFFLLLLAGTYYGLRRKEQLGG